MRRSSSPIDLEAAEGSARAALDGITCPRCSVRKLNASSIMLRLCAAPRGSSDLGGYVTGDLAYQAFELDHPEVTGGVGIDGLAEALERRNWVETTADLGRYLAEKAPAVPRIILDPTDNPLGDNHHFVPSWAAILLGVGSQMVRAKLSLGAWPNGGGPNPNDLVNWPSVLQRAGSDPEFRRVVYAIIAPGTCSTVGLREWLCAFAPDVFGR